MFTLLPMAALVLAIAGSIQDDRAAVSAHLPSQAAKDLAGRNIALPGELPGPRTILIVAFERDQQPDVDGWVTRLGLVGGALPWLELPVIDNPGALARWFIDTGMRRGIKDRDTWRHVVTLYTKKADFKAAVGIASESTVYAMVVDRRGTILAFVPGRATDTGAAAIKAAMAS